MNLAFFQMKNSMIVQSLRIDFSLKACESSNDDSYKIENHTQNCNESKLLYNSYIFFEDDG